MIKFRSELIATAYKKDQFPTLDLPEIAIAGRSNVGKSSLINSLLEHRIAHVASQPGKTRSVNFIKVDSDDVSFMLVDLPGYGYAARSKKEQKAWADLIGEYFISRPSLELIVSLVDFRHGLLANDLQLQEWITSQNIPFQVVFTKVDKISRGHRKQMLYKYIRTGLRSIDVPQMTSVKTKDGIEELRGFLISYIKKILNT